MPYILVAVFMYEFSQITHKVSFPSHCFRNQVGNLFLIKYNDSKYSNTGRQRAGDTENTDVTVTYNSPTIFHGQSASTTTLAEASMRFHAEATPKYCVLNDSRAQQVLVTYMGGWHAIPTPDIFSRHTGTCILIGDKATPSCQYQLKLGDCVRFGSVGLVVSELRGADGIVKCLDRGTLEYLKVSVSILIFSTSPPSFLPSHNPHGMPLQRRS